MILNGVMCELVKSHLIIFLLWFFCWEKKEFKLQAVTELFNCVSVNLCFFLS